MITHTIGHKAVVVGGSIAGLLSARVLSDFFEKVYVVDRDALHETDTPRRGVPQGVHYHGILARGRLALHELFPGFDDDLIAAGATVSSHAKTLVYQPYGWAPKVQSDERNVGASRLLIERVLRQRCRSLARIDFRPDSQVTSLLATADRSSIIGVRVHPEHGSDFDLLADLVVDASGRNSPIEAWLDTHGYGEVEASRVDAFWGYASRHFEVPDGTAPPLVVGLPLGLAGDGPTATRGGFMSRQEHGRCIVTLCGCGKDFPPIDAAGFHAFARSLAFPQIADAIEAARPISEITSWRNTSNRLRHFERLARWPEGLAVVGDAFCSLNPAYGQGMTTAALQALALQLELTLTRSDIVAPHTLGRRYQRRAAAAVEQAWNLATRSDLALSRAWSRSRPEGAEERWAYLQRVVAAGRDDPSIFARLMATNQMLSSEDWIDETAVRRLILERWDELGKLVGRKDPAPIAA